MATRVWDGWYRSEALEDVKPEYRRCIGCGGKIPYDGSTLCYSCDQHGRQHPESREGALVKGDLAEATRLAIISMAKLAIREESQNETL